MEYTSQVNDKILTLKLEGDLIGEHDGVGLLEIVNDKINESINLCAIDLSEVRYMNSSGIGVLITVLTKFRNKGGEVVLLKPSEQIKKLLLITKLSSIFNIVDSDQEAEQVLNSSK